MVFNPSSIDRLIHVILGCWLAGIFLVMSVSAYYYFKKKHLAFSKATMKISLITAGITLVLQLISADSTAKGVAKSQPAKLAAMEGVYQTQPSTPMTLFGWVDEASGTVKGPKIPGLLSFLSYTSWTQPVTGLDQVPVDERPPVQLVFQSYHLMIWMWFFMALITVLGLWRYKKGNLERSKLLLWAMMCAVGFPQIANQMGWMTAEVGRQPWIVYGILKTSEGISPNINAGQVLRSIIMFAVIYTLLLVLFLYLLDQKIKHGPDPVEATRREKQSLYRNPFKALLRGKS